MKVRVHFDFIVDIYRTLVVAEKFKTMSYDKKEKYLAHKAAVAMHRRLDVNVIDWEVI